MYFSPLEKCGHAADVGFLWDSLNPILILFSLTWSFPLITRVVPGHVLSIHIDSIPLIIFEFSLDPWIQVSLKISTCS